MPIAPAAPRAVATPLSRDERARAGRVAERLHADLRRLVRSLPEAAQGGSGMSRHLGIVRNTCQRVVAAVQDSAATPETLAKLPGVKGLESFIDALRERGADAAELDLAGVGVQQFDALIVELAGSHAKLAARLHATTDTAPAQGDLSSDVARAALFQAAVGVTGRACEVSPSVYAFRPDPENPDILERALANGLVQTTMMPGGMPIVLTSGNTIRWSEDEAAHNLDDSATRGRTPEALLEEFTTRPLPTVSSRGEAEKLIQVIDPASLDGPTTIDVVTAVRGRHPMFNPETGNPTLDEVWTLVNCPTRHLVLDVYLHASMERRYRPSIDALLWYPNLATPGDDRWTSRYPSQPTIELLGRGLERAHTPRWTRHGELTRTLFDRLGWDAGEYVGFRCSVDYPIWRAGYCMSFEYAAD